ncbi:MAG TPA: lipid IV(A) 3-deoxy-D-manno-octulosonic acid transferase, partial [Methylophilaceae bacterium]|nr:lipid IV(A) 3-deoxy-D-manno-octulosonic acid transferase [Methylophilaceae bacterium]
MPRILYTLLFYLLLPITPLRLLWRGLRQPEYLRHWGERFGFYSHKVDRPVIWLHCVSVGETRAAAPLVQELQQRYPQHIVLLTHATPTGRATSEQLFGDQVLRAYLPYDVPDAVSRFLKHFRPAIGLLMETELWFNLIAACKKRGMPLLLVNARLSQKSAHGYAQIARLTEEGLAGLAAIAAQTDVDAERLQSLGAQKVLVMGNLKFDVEPPADAADLGLQLRVKLGKNRPVFLAASTRENEEALILDAIASAKIPQLLSIIVPRHPQRFEEVANLFKKRGIRYIRRSQLDHAELISSVEVVLGDSMGEMFTYYAASDVAFIGGSLLPYGGQNLIEASAMGKPVLVGPYTYNFSAASEQAIAAQAAWRVGDSTDLAKALQRLFGDPELRQSMGWAALDFSSSAGGAAHRIAELVQSYLSQPG